MGLNGKVVGGGVKEREAEAEAQRHRVENDVRMTYYHVLAAQERLAIERDLVGITRSPVHIVPQLGNVGQADETEVLEAEAEQQRMQTHPASPQHTLQPQSLTLLPALSVP